MMHHLFAAVGMLVSSSAVLAAAPVVCRSPDGKLAIEFSLRNDGSAPSVPHYRVRTGKGEVVGWSRLGVGLAGGERLGGACEMIGVEARAVRDEYEQFPGKRRRVVGRATETTIRLRERAEPHRRWEVVLRAYDDGVAFRYRFPKQDGWKRLLIAGERTRFAFPRGTVAWALPLNGFTTSYERRYQRLNVDQLPAKWLLGLPLLVRLPSAGWAAVTEADLDEYAGMYLAPMKGGNLSARLSPLPKEPKLAVKAPLPHESPWRVIMVTGAASLGSRIRENSAVRSSHSRILTNSATTRDAGRLIESDIVLNLNKPRAVKDVSWIKPGKTTFPWWNGYVLDGVAFKPGLNTATMKHYIDFCAANGIEYHSLDGLGNTAWYGGPINPYRGADPTTALPAIDLPAVLKHAKAKGVRLRLWMNWKAAETHMARSFPLYRKWGVEGVMLDFMDRDDQEMNRFLRRAVKLAAENRLTVTLNGVAKPTGLERTYPNLLTHEGVLNLEYNKWDKLGCGPGHQVTVAFTRMLAGPLDFHQGSFRGVSPGTFKPRNNAPLVMGTPCRTLAGYVVYQNHLSMVADSPSAYAGHPALPVLVQIPTTWDDTRFVAGSVGEYVAIARRSGTTWHLGAMTDRQPRTLKLPLTFLRPGRYTVESWVDDPRAKFGLSRRTATAAETVTVRLDVAGGAYVRFRRVK